ncbi:melatonin receptor type 1A-A-like [Mizuhopecten yessoensis]|nr:melatonin receptor type 1A-A-like [Mizuhopecten yessoensis]
MCLLNGIIAHICFSTSVQTIMVIAINRFVKICCTTKYDMIFDNRKMVLILVYTYSVGPIFLVPLLVMGDSQLVYDATLQMCIFDRYGNWRCTTIYQTLCLALPILITAYCYCSVYRTVMKTRSQVMQRFWNNGLQKRRIQHELVVTRSQFAIFIAYLVLYIPFGVTAVFVTDRLSVPVSLHAAGIYLCYLNSCINGLIYGLLNKNIQQAYREALPCFRRKHNVIAVQPFLPKDSYKVRKKAVSTQTESCV